MWHSSTITSGPPAGKPVTLLQAKGQCGVQPGEAYFDDRLTMLMASGLAHAEKYCGTRFAPQTAVMACDSFADFGYLPEAPVQSITSIAYVDPEGVTQTLAETVYELLPDGLEPSIALISGQSWPARAHGSRVKVTAVIGYDPAPPDVVDALLRFIADGFETREIKPAEGWSMWDSLLCNHRRGAP